MRTHISPKQLARAIGVSESSIKRWCDRDLLPTVRTPGGHRRIPLSEAVQYVRKEGHEVVDPAVLGLPSITGKGERLLDRSRGLLVEALREGDEESFRRTLFDLYLSGRSLVEVLDQVLAPAFTDLGEEWQHGSLEVYQERRGVEITLRALYDLGRLLPAPEPGAPTALGGTLEGDTYTLPTFMVELALREEGWDAASYGAGHPAETLVRGLRDKRPRLFWISVSHVPDHERLVTDLELLHGTCEDLGIPLALGGRALGEDERRDLAYTVFCEDLRRVVSFARTFAAAKERAPGQAPL